MQINKLNKLIIYLIKKNDHTKNFETKLPKKRHQSQCFDLIENIATIFKCDNI